MQIVIGLLMAIVGVAMFITGIKETVDPEHEIQAGQEWEYFFQGRSEAGPFERSSLHYCTVLEVKDGWVRWKNKALDGHEWEQTSKVSEFRRCKRLLSGKPESPFSK